MSGFSWLAFLQRHHIEYNERGKSTHKGNVYISCPFCRDGKKMMGLSLESQKWGCWKDPKGHGGGHAPYLIMALLGCSLSAAKEEVASNEPGTTDLGAVVAMLERGGEVEPAPLAEQTYPKEFVPIRKGDGSAPMSWYYDYLLRRGFDLPARMSRYYDLRAALGTIWDGRVVMPLAIGGKLYGWTGRAISKKQELRYMTWPEGNGVARLIFNYDKAALGGRILTAVEGPVDALKIDWYGQDIGVRGISLLGLNFNSHRVELVSQLMEKGKFDRFVVMMDREALGRSLDFTTRAPHLHPEVIQVPDDFKDPGEMTRKAIHRVFS